MLEARLLHFAWCVLLFAVLLAGGGCENSIEPFSGKGRYAIYGYVSPSSDLQSIRVKPLPIPITKIDSNSLDATVTLANLTDGTSEVLKDSIVTFEDEGSTVLTHNFWTDTPVLPGTKYRVSIEGPDGSVTRATATTPERREGEVSPKHGTCLDNFTVDFRHIDARRLWRTVLEVKYREEWHEITMEEIGETEEGTLALTFNPERVLKGLIPFQQLPEGRNSRCWYAPRCSELESDTIAVRFTYLGPDWYGDIPEDSVRYDPLRSYFVTNGLGFFGALGRAQTSVSVDTTEILPINDRFCSH